MPTTTNKQRLLTQLFATQNKKLLSADQGSRPVLEQFIYGLCREGTTRERADRAFKNLAERFFDWNEIRVSSVREVEEALDDLPGAEARAERLISFLQEVFETTFSFDLDQTLQKKGLKQAAKHLSRYAAANDYVVSWVVQHSLGGHAIPLDAPTLRAADRMGLIEAGQEDAEGLRATLEHLVPKAKGPQFVEVLSRLVEDYCWEDCPHCSACPLAADCPTGQESTREGAAVPARAAARPKPR
jgi:endonuclease-3